jgi:L-serine deaminase
MDSNIKSPLIVVALVNGTLIFTPVYTAIPTMGESAVAQAEPDSLHTHEIASTSAIREPVVAAVTTTGNMTGLGISSSVGYGHLTALK